MFGNHVTNQSPYSFTCVFILSEGNLFPCPSKHLSICSLLDFGSAILHGAQEKPVLKCFWHTRGLLSKGSKAEPSRASSAGNVAW